MPNDGAVANSSNFGATAIQANLATPEPAPAASTPAPAATPARGGQPEARPAPGQGVSDIERMFGQVPDVPAEEQAASEPNAQDPDAQQAQAQEDDEFIAAEPVPELDEMIHGVKARDLIAALKAGSIPAEVIDKLANVTIPALEEQIHGVRAGDLLTAIKEKRLPTELLETLTGTATINGQPLEISFREALNGYQRLSDTSKKNKLIAAERQRLDERDAAFKGMLDSWQKDPIAARAGAKRFGFMEQIEKTLFDGFDKPETLRQMLTRRGYGPSLYDVAKAITQEEIELHEMCFSADGKPNPRGQAIAARLRQERAGREALDRDTWLKDQQLQDIADRQRMQQQRARQQPQQQQTSQASQELLTRIGQAMPDAFKMKGVRASKYAERVFAEEMSARIGEHRGDLSDPVIARMVLDSAQATAEILGDERAAANGALPANSNGGGGRPPLLAALNPAAPAAAPANQQTAAPQQSPAQQQVAAATAQQAARAQQPNPSPLSPRPGATPTAPAATGVNPYGGNSFSSEDFQSHMARLRGARR